ncbi:MAG TPA: glutaredoxin family protein [Candidatus Nanoarchaeia archaeon]|nr:glutaredoxin family protein [Candidatus Nanoarchaeia archaeon]
MKVKVYTMKDCMACKETVSWLKKNKIKFDEIDVTFDNEAQDYLKSKVGHSFVPIIEVDGTILDPTKAWFEKLKEIFK